ncbi:hypothetical protein AUP68_02048 [Ilyonectria robusta]
MDAAQSSLLTQQKASTALSTSPPCDADGHGDARHNSVGQRWMAGRLADGRCAGRPRQSGRRCVAGCWRATAGRASARRTSSHGSAPAAMAMAMSRLIRTHEISQCFWEDAKKKHTQRDRDRPQPGHPGLASGELRPTQRSVTRTQHQAQ